MKINMEKKSEIFSNEVSSESIKEHIKRVDDPFNIDDFKSYTRKMDKLNDIMTELRTLSIHLGKSISTYTVNGEGKEYAEYYNEQNAINYNRNKEYIESMFKYIVKEQKELVDDMYSKLKLDQIYEFDDLDSSEIYELPEITEIDDNK